MRFLLFDWTIEGHHARYLRCFAEMLGTMGEVVVGAPHAIASAVEDLPVRVAMLPSSRPPVDLHLPVDPQHRRLATAELDLLENVVNDVQPDHLIHLSADPIIRQLVKRPPLKVATTLFLFCPRAHYPSAYNSPLSAKERLRAWFLEYLVARWRHRPDAYTILTLDPEAARRWAGGRGGAHWIPEPPIGPLPDLPSDGRRSGCILYGSLAKRKGIHLLARAIAMEPVSLDVTLAGAVEPGFQEEFSTYIKQMRTFGAQVHLQTNFLTESEGLRALAGARCAVLPYPQHYTMSRVLVEACSVGTPVIVHHRGLLGHLVRQNNLGMALDCLDSGVLRHGLLNLCAEDLSSQYAEAHARFVRMFSRDAFQQALRGAFAQSGPQVSGIREPQPLAHQIP
jgi:glycosyltransferase involved in cell wall biosynthesis